MLKEQAAPSRLQVISDTFFRTRGFFPILVMAGLSGTILAWMDQGQDLLRSVTDITTDHSGVSLQVLWLCLSVTVLGFQAWFWARVIVDVEFGPRSTWPLPLYLTWAPRVLGLVPFVLLTIALHNLKTPTPWLATVLAGLGVIFLVFVWGRLKFTNGIRKASSHMAKSGRPKMAASIDVPLNHLRWVILLVGICYAAISMIVITIDPVTLPVFFGPAAVVLTASALIIPVFITIMLIGSRFHLRVAGGLIALAVVFSFWVDNHGIRLSTPVGVRPTIKEAYLNWRKPFEGSNRPIPMIFVASEGGASRAGYWTAAVMSQLEKESGGEFSKHIFAVSSISGGSLGVAGFIATVKDGAATSAILSGKSDLREVVSDFVGRDYLSPALAGLLFPDLVQRFFPISVLPDRSTSLETGWERGWADHCKEEIPCDNANRMKDDFLSLWSNTPDLIPVWLIGGALVEDGRPVITSSVNFGDSIDAWDFHSLTKHDVRLSTAILNGARFPFVSAGGTLVNPATPQPTPAVHVVDGGYFDAAGVESVRELATTMLGPGGIAANDNVDPIFLLITNDGINPPFSGHDEDLPDISLPIGCRGQIAKLGCPGSASSLAPDALGPLLGLYRSRSAHGERLKALLYRSTPVQPAHDRKAEVLTVDLCEYDVPMNWALSQNARRMVDGLLISRDVQEQRPCEKANNSAFDFILQKLKG